MRKHTTEPPALSEILAAFGQGSYTRHEIGRLFKKTIRPDVLSAAILRANLDGFIVPDPDREGAFVSAAALKLRKGRE